MNRTIRKTRACTIETLDEELRNAIRGHGTEYRLQNLETDVLMCCETLSAWQQKGFHGGIRTTLSVIYVTPIWLVWADGGLEQTAIAGTARLKHIDVINACSPGGYSISPDQGLHVSGHFTHENSIRTMFVLLDFEAEGRKFLRVLREALLASRGSERISQKVASHSFRQEKKGQFQGKPKRVNHV